jgi:pyrroloquinoline quinone biosynthesis protein A
MAHVRILGARRLSEHIENASHENHEARFHVLTMPHTGNSPMMHRVALPNGATKTNTDRRHIMKWETPAACDFRFGFEITMYIANR